MFIRTAALLLGPLLCIPANAQTAMPLPTTLPATTEAAPTATVTTPANPPSPTAGIILNQNATDFVYRAPTLPDSNATLVYSFSLIGFPHFRVSYYNSWHEAEENKHGLYAKAAFTWRAGIFRIVEFNSTINITESTSFISLIGKEPQWTPIQVTSTSVHNGTGPVSVIQQANTTFTEHDFRMTLSAVVSKVPLKMGNDTLRPDSLKYSIGFTGFPYKYENSQIAIVKAELVVARFAVVAAKFDCKQDGGICVAGGMGVMYWTPTVDLDDNKHANISFTGTIEPLSQLLTPQENTRLQTLAHNETEDWGATVFTVPTNRSNLFFWDPEM
ncbi:hypothetical protein HDU98_002744, partial [Podochytrium sp. JEL0797]